MIFRKIALSVAALLTLSVFVGDNYLTAQSHHDSDDSLMLEEILYHANDGQSVSAEQGFFSVPEDWNDPTSSEIELSFVRFSSTSEISRPPVVYLVGGPGNSGFFVGKSEIFSLLMALREFTDVILFEQRGTFGATPFLQCPAAWRYPIEHPVNEITLLESFRSWSEDCASHWTAQGTDLMAYHTLNSARDIDHLRNLVGAEKLNIMGFSYGTHLGLAYVKSFPQYVERAVLAGVEGLNQSLKLPQNVDEILLDLDQTANILDKLASLLQRLEEAPITVGVSDPDSGQLVDVPISRFAIEWLMSSILGDRDDIEAFVQIVELMDQGNFDVVASAFLDLFNPNTILAMTFTTDCASGLSSERYSLIQSQGEAAILGGAINFPFPEVCEFWPYRNLGESFRSAFQSAIPTLFISGSLDARTPPANVEEFINDFSNGHHLVVEHGTHGNELLVGDSQIADEIVRFIQGTDPHLDRIALPPLEF